MSLDLHKTNEHRTPLKAVQYGVNKQEACINYMGAALRSYIKLYISDNHVSDGMLGQITPEEMPEDWIFSRDISINVLRRKFTMMG